MPDVVIIGAGPAGLALGCYLADRGIRPLVLEKHNHPRPHVGESIMPSTVEVLREIGFHDLAETAGFPRSTGIVYRPPSGEDVPVRYDEFPVGGAGQSYTYHVDRARFDMLLMKHAESKGCRIVQGCGVTEVVFEGDGRCRGVRARIGGQPISIDAKIVVDAAGRATRIGRQLGLRRDHPVLDQFALHAWFVGVDRGQAEFVDRTHVYFLPEARGWAWQSPISEDITSVGVVASKGRYQGRGLVIEEFFDTTLQLNPKLAAAMGPARRINDLKGEANYSYSLDRVCGDGWLAIGDAARFLDPVFSSGVSVGMHTGRLAADRIALAVEQRDASRETFLPYEDKVLAASAVWDDFIRLFYRLLPAFVHLLQSPEHRPAMLKMIQGDTWDTDDAGWLEELRRLVRDVEETDRHPWKDELFEFPVA